MMILPKNYSLPILAIVPQSQQREELIVEWKKRYPIILDISKEETPWDLSVLSQKFSEPTGGIINIVGRSIYLQNSLLIPIESLKNYWRILLLIDNKSDLLKTLESRVEVIDLSQQTSLQSVVNFTGYSLTDFIKNIKELDNQEFLASLKNIVDIETFAWCTQMISKGSRKEWVAAAIYHDIM